MVKNLPANDRRRELDPGSGRSPRDGNGNLLQYSCLGNPMDRGAWQAPLSMGFPRQVYCDKPLMIFQSIFMIRPVP